MPGRFITVHGIDGTGKTTTTDKLVSALQTRNIEAQTYDTLLVDESGFSKDARSGQRSPQAQLYRSLGTKCIQGLAIQEALAEGKSVVKDRWAIDVLAANSYLGATVPSGELGILVPDLSILLICSEQVRQQRIGARGHATTDDLVPNTLGTRAYYFERYLMDHLDEHCCRSSLIDTTYMTADEVAEQIAGLVLEMQEQ